MPPKHVWVSNKFAAEHGYETQYKSNKEKQNLTKEKA